MPDYGLLAGLAEGLKSGVQSYQDTSRYNDERKRKMEQDALAKRLADYQMLNAGYQQSDGGQIEMTPEKMREKSFEETVKQGGLLKSGQKAELNPETNAYNLVPVPGFKDTETDLTRAKIKTEEARAKELLARAGGGKNAGGKIVPANDALQAGSVEASLAALDDVSNNLANNKDIIGPAQGRLSSLQALGEFGETGKRAKVLRGNLRTNAQIIGKYLEGGKLTDSDIARYEQMLPGLNDSEEVAQNKIASLQRLIAQKQNSELNTLQSAGYDTNQMARAPITATPGLLTKTRPAAGLLAPQAGASQMNPEDQAAMEWAQANKQDPRAVQIMKRLGVK